MGLFDWAAALFSAQLRDRERENEVLIKEVQRLRALTDGTAMLRALSPRTVQERVWRCMVLYGFTQPATTMLWKTCEFVDTTQYVGQGSEYVGGLIRLIPGQDQDGRVLHELTHAALHKMGLGGPGYDWSRYKAAFERLALGGEGAPELVVAARRLYYDIVNNPSDPYRNEHLFVYFITNGYPDAPVAAGLMGRMALMPDYLRPFFEPVFTGALL